MSELAKEAREMLRVMEDPFFRDEKLVTVRAMIRALADEVERLEGEDAKQKALLDEFVYNEDNPPTGGWPSREEVESLREESARHRQLMILQHSRTIEADRAWQKAHNKPDVFPDLGELIEWLMEIRG